MPCCARKSACYIRHAVFSTRKICCVIFTGRADMTERVSGLRRIFHQMALLFLVIVPFVFPQGSAAQAIAPASASDAAAPPPGRAQVLTFAQMGANYTIPLRGIDPERTVNVGVRLDEVVTAARLKLVFTYSPSLVYPLSHLKIRINDEVVATLPLDQEHAGQQISREIDIDPRYFTDFNRINVQMISHYTLDHF